MGRQQIGVAPGDIAAELRHELHLTTGLPQQFGQWAQADSQTQPVHFEVAFRTRDLRPFFVQLADSNPFQPVSAIGAFDRVAGIDRHAAALDFRGMDPVRTDFRRRLDDRRHFDSRLQQLVGDNHADIAGADHQYSLSRLDAIDIHQGLHGSGSVNAGQVVIGKRQRLFRRAGRHNQLLRFHQTKRVALFDRQHPVRVIAESGGIPPYGDIGQLRQLIHQFMGDFKAAFAGVFFARTKKFMRLFDQLAAQFSGPLQQQHLRPHFGGLNRRHQSSRTSADNSDICLSHTSFPFPAWVSTCMPARRGSTQTRTLGTPSTVIRQEEQLPIAQNKPRGR